MQVSVIIPCYNVEKWLDRCLTSIVMQTIGIENIQIICLDDCSTDSTMDRLTRWEQKYPENIMVIQLTENRRQGNARNIGLQYASCDWISFIDSDDWIEPDFFEMLFRAADTGEYEVVCCGSHRDSSTILRTDAYREPFNIKAFDITTEEERKDFIIHPPMEYTAWGKIIRKSLLLDNELFFLSDLTYEDAAWGSLLHIYSSRICMIEAQLYHYFVNEESTVLKKNSNHHLDCITVQTWLWDEYKRRGLIDTYKDELEIEHIYNAGLSAIKVCILRYEIPDYNVYLLVRQLLLERIGNYKENPYVKCGELPEIYTLIMEAIMTGLSKAQFYEFAEYIKKLGI